MNMKNVQNEKLNRTVESIQSSSIVTSDRSLGKFSRTSFCGTGLRFKRDVSHFSSLN